MQHQPLQLHQRTTYRSYSVLTTTTLKFLVTYRGPQRSPSKPHHDYLWSGIDDNYHHLQLHQRAPYRSSPVLIWDDTSVETKLCTSLRFEIYELVSFHKGTRQSVQHPRRLEGPKIHHNINYDSRAHTLESPRKPWQIIPATQAISGKYKGAQPSHHNPLPTCSQGDEDPHYKWRLKPTTGSNTPEARGLHAHKHVQLGSSRTW